ncbi:MAG TPA: heavy-metal-associated domain-containing protein [Flavisolibacter sp.]
MKKYQFKTNINCSGCVAQVTPHLKQNESIKEWEVDTQNPSKILTVETEDLSAEEVKQIVEKAGFKAETL